MTMDEHKISPVKLFEKVVSLEGKTSAAHSRLDKLETGIRDDLKEIKNELKEVAAYINKGKGLYAASVVVSGILGGICALVAKLIFH